MEQKVRDWTETTFYFPENHWFRLASHIVIKGTQVGTLAGAGLGIPYALLRKRPVGKTVGLWSLVGGLVGSAVLGGVAYYKFQTTDQAGIEDRSFRLAHNWNQIKHDYMSLMGVAFGGLFFRGAFGGFFRGAAVGMALGSVSFIAQSQFSSTEKPDLSKMKGL